MYWIFQLKKKNSFLNPVPLWGEPIETPGVQLLSHYDNNNIKFEITYRTLTLPFPPDPRTQISHFNNIYFKTKIKQ